MDDWIPEPVNRDFVVLTILIGQGEPMLVFR